MSKRKYTPVVLTVKISDEDELNPGRLWILAGFLAVVFLLYIGVMYDAQVIHHEEYLAQSVRSIVRTETVKASRGIITDRNGKTLISNAFAYDLTFDVTLLKKDQEPNGELLRLLKLCVSQGRGWNDSLPVTWEEPFAITVDNLPLERKRQFLSYLIELRESRDKLAAYLRSHTELVDLSDLEPPEPEEDAEPVETEKSLRERLAELRRGGSGTVTPVLDNRKMAERLDPSLLSDALLADAGIDAESLMNWMSREFSLPDGLTEMERRSVLGVRYELRLRVIGADNSAYVLTENIDTDFISVLADGSYAGAKVLNSSVRQYETDAAAHILGTVGSLFKEDLENPFYEGYPLDATVGRSGAEAAFEQYLHGTDGRRVLSVSEDGKITGEYYSKEPKPGSTVELTLDLDFQKATEAALKDAVEGLNAKDRITNRGAGCAVVKVGTGEILAVASYPTFTLNEYRTNYTALSKDKSKPLLNRATNGLYPPGSTLKPATAFAALDSGKTTLTERIYDYGRWGYPGSSIGTYCWVRTGHGVEYLSQAITDSCNYYFAEMGYRMGLERLNSYLEQFGLGEHTGIETGDSKGQRAENPPGQDQAPWAAYGQSTQLYTPLQLANYIATLASGGKHCEAHLLKAVKSYDKSQVLATGNTEPVNIIDIKPAYLNAIRTGMHNLARGQLDAYFSECVVDAAAKTGTAQLGAGKANNAVFVCFAPYENPEIALSMVIEKGGSGSTLTSTAVRILNAYFDREKTASVTGENTLIP